MAVVAQLLGPPLVTREGVVYAPPRGKKVWAVLAYLALAERPPTRQELASLLFPEAEDPANALRWNLSELRRLLGGPETVGSGATVGLRLPSGSTLDVSVLLEGTSAAAVELPGLGRELLEGINVEASPGFDAWLLGERRRLQGLGGAVLREGALRALAAGDTRGAVALATRLLGADPLSEDAHVLLVRAFAATGDEVAVERQLAASVDLFQREFGIDIAPELYGAARMETRAEATAGGRAAAEALLESGEAAIAAGAFDRGLGELRDAAASASASGETAVEAAALLGWGSALVHGAKGRDEDGSAALHRAMRAAESVGDRRTAAAAQRELGYVELLRGEYARSTVWLKRALTFADDDPLELSWIHAVMGASLSDTGKHEQATEEFETSMALATAVDNGRALAWALTCWGRAQLLRGELEAAQDTLSTARERTRAEHWTAFLSFPEALLGEVWVRRGDLDAAAALFEHAFTLGCSVDDACWEAYSVRGIGLLDAARGDLDGAIARFEDALARCLRQRDTHTWIRAYVLDALCATATAAKDARADGWVAELGALAGRCGMREFQVHAYLYRADLGDLDALEAARALAGGVENPHLQGMLDAAGPPMLEVLLGA